MSIPGALAILGAGLVAGAVNTIVGSGSLITFPTLLAVGYPATLANVSNTVGLVPGAISGAIGYRRELAGQGPRIRALAVASLSGGLTGAVLLLVLPAKVFSSVVPLLILVACVLVALQPRLARMIAERAEGGRRPAHGGGLLLAAIFVTAIYGGYFGAAQSVIVIALLGIFLEDSLQRLNALKNVLAALTHGVAALVFMAVADVAWGVAILLAISSGVGGQIGATVGRRIPARPLRFLIMLVGTAVALRLLV
jgi:uncharacterized protein